MDTPLALLIGLLAAVATWLMLSRNLIRLLLGFAMLGNAVNLLIFTAGRLTRNFPPIVPEGSESLAGAYANPLPQALVLTAIVIGFALTVILAALALRAWNGHGTLRTDEIRSARDLGDPLAPEPGHDR